MPAPRISVPIISSLLLCSAVAAQGASPPLLLFGPMTTTDAHLVDRNGNTVHTWVTPHPPGVSVYLDQDGTLLRTIATGVPPGAGGGSGGGLQRLALDGTVLWDFRYDTGGVWAHHDIEPLPNGNVLMIAWEDKTPAEAIAAGRDPASLSTVPFRPDHIIEVQQTGLTTGTIVWQWHVWDHLIQDFDPTKANFGVVADHPELVDINYPPGGNSGDWNHCNGIDYDPVNDWIVLSSRFQEEIWIIDHSTTTAEAAGHTGGNYGMGGDLIYRWGNPQVYQRGTAANQQTFGQHSSNFIPQGYPGAGNILLFNNLRPGGSSADELVLPLDASGRFVIAPGQPFGPSTATVIHQLGYTSQIVSSARRAKNGNTLICAGQQGNLLEVDPNGRRVFALNYGQPIFHAHYVERMAWSDRASVSANAGGSVNFDLIAGTGHAARLYLMLGSASGTQPGFSIHGQPVPLVPDSYLLASATYANSGAFGGTLGTLDGFGRARSTLTVPSGLPALVGLHLDHAFLIVEPTTIRVLQATNAVPLDLTQ